MTDKKCFIFLAKIESECEIHETSVSCEDKNDTENASGKIKMYLNKKDRKR